MAEATGLGYTWGYNDLSTLLDFVNYGGSVLRCLTGIGSLILLCISRSLSKPVLALLQVA